MSSTVTDDPFVLQVRRELSDLDSAMVELVNKRLKLVAKLKRYKDEHGIGFVDLAREQWMLQYLQRANRGPLSEEGLAELYHELLDLTKREVSRGGEALRRHPSHRRQRFPLPDAIFSPPTSTPSISPSLMLKASAARQ